MNDLSKIPTCELVFELQKREGITTCNAEPYDEYEISTKHTKIKDIGPAIILCVID